MQQLDPIYVDVTQSSSELLRLRRELAAGNLERNGSPPVTILLEDGSEFSHKGTPEFSEVSVDPSTGSFNLRLRVDNPRSGEHRVGKECVNTYRSRGQRCPLQKTNRYITLYVD